MSSDDIVTRLRVIHCAADDLTPCGTCLTCRAADEIERLRDELAAWQATVRAHDALAAERAAEIERLRNERDEWQVAFHKAFSELGLVADKIERLCAAGDALADSYNSVWIGIANFDQLFIDKWQEARRAD